MAQFARPDSNVTQTSFTNGFAEIDESTPSDADFAFGANNTAAELEVGLSNVTDPTSSTGHIFRYRVAKTNAGTVDGTGNSVTVTARLMQGTTQIATDTAKTADGTWTQYAYTLTGGEADAITDYTDLRLEFVTSTSGGAPANRRGGAVSWAELEVPSAAQTVQNNFISAGTTLFNPAVHLTIFANLISGTALFDPGVLSDQIVEANFISATALYEPAVGALVEAQFISAGTQLFSPTNVHQEIVANLISQTTTYAPAVSVVVEAQLIASSTQIFNPAAQHVIEANLLGAATQVFIPAAEHLVVTEFITSTTVVFNPATVQLVEVQLISLTQLFNPSIGSAGTPQSVVALLISGTSLFDPAAIADQLINANLISATTLVHNPDVAMVVLAVGPAVGTTVFTPGLVADQIIVAQLLQSGQLFSPAIGGDLSANGPYGLSLGTRFSQLRTGKSSVLAVLRRLGN